MTQQHGKRGWLASRFWDVRRRGSMKGLRLRRPALEPLLERIHRGLKHAGKVPVAERARAARALVAGLKDDLATAIATERYEDAARLRDRIKTLERTE